MEKQKIQYHHHQATEPVPHTYAPPGEAKDKVPPPPND